MRVSYNWLREYIDLDISAQTLGERYTSAGLELDEVISRGKDFSKVVVARVMSCDSVEGSDHLHSLTVDVGEDKLLSIVCGAPNIAAGQLVACARVGAVLPGGFEIGARKTFGIMSEGMICSQKELGLSDDHAGIWVLDSAFEGVEAPLGQDIQSALGLDDDILLLELTPNRSDCLGMLNCAREAAALTGLQLQEPDLSYAEEGGKIADSISIEVRDFDLCPRYDARLVKNIKIGPSPLWMQNYLLAAGMRPINNVVDISNFVMLEMNQPLHTFDYDTLKDRKIVVRAAYEGENMTTLDGKERKFSGEELLICDGKDGERPICVAGVMGGMETEVTEKTTSVLIESACFNQVAIRKASRKLGIPSEASMRFEKGVDVASCDIAARRAAQLLVKYCGGVADCGNVDVLAEKYREGFMQKTIALRTERVNRILGTDFSTGEIVEVMHRLGFGVEELHDTLLVKTPSYRQDISLEVDLIEEVARLKGFGLIPRTMPLNPTKGGRTEQQKLLLKLKNLCASYGLYETVTYSFISEKESDKLQLAADHPWRVGLRISNPLSEEQSVMRQTMLPGLLNAASRNMARRNLDLRFFETGMVFLPAAENTADTQPEEVLMLGMVLAGSRTPDWQTPARPYDFYDLKAILEGVTEELGAGKLSFTKAAEEYLHPGHSAQVSLNGIVLGVIGELHPDAAEAYELEGRVCVAELAISPLFMAAMARGNVRHDLPRYPASTRDIAVIGSVDIAAGVIERQIIESGGDILSSVKLFDLYDKAPIPQGQRSLAYALQFRADDRTLTDEDVELVDKGRFCACPMLLLS